MKTSIYAAAVSLVALVSSIPAMAQGPSLPLVGSPSSITAGVFLPSSSDAKNAGGSTQFDVNFNYTLPVPNVTSVSSRTILGLGVEAGSKSGKHETIVPITIGQIYSLSGGGVTQAGQTYAGAGLGVYVLNQSGLATSGKIGGYVQLGYNINDTTFVDAKYQGVKSANGFTANVGFRF